MASRRSKWLRSTCSRIFRYGIATARAERDVAADLRGALIVPKPRHRAAITTPKAASELLRALDAFEGHPNTHAAFRLLPHIFVRPGELRFRDRSSTSAVRSDLDFSEIVS